MGILLFFFSFVFIFFNTVLLYNKTKSRHNGLRISFISSSLLISFLTVLSTELLSSFRNLNFHYISVTWAVILLCSFVIFFWLFKNNRNSFNTLNIKKALFIIDNSSPLIKIFLLSSIIILIGLFLVALTPPDNYDSYTYHLPRIEHWIQNRNVDFYPTNNVRQLYLSPFAEYFILTLRVLSNDILYNNFVQYFSMLNSLLLVSLITKSFGLDYKSQIIASVIALTIPMGLLQATTTQTDYVVSFFLASSVFYGIASTNDKSAPYHIFFLCLSFALGILTKATFYIFSAPFLLFFSIYYIKQFKYRFLYIALLSTIILLLVDFNFLFRNINEFGSPLGPKKISSYYLANLNETFGIQETLSNVSKNIGLHLALPNDSYNKSITYAIAFFHDIIFFPLNSSSTSWFSMPYEIHYSLHHDTIGNFIHIILFFISVRLCFLNLKSVNKDITGYLFALITGFFLFAFLLKWQPWQTRLDLPWFVLSAPFIAYALSRYRQKYFSSIVCIILLFISIKITYITHPNKPIIGPNSIYKKEIGSYIIGLHAANIIEAALQKNHIASVGLIMDSNFTEWQHWYVSNKRRFESVYFPDDFIHTPNFDNNFKYQAIIIDNSYLMKPYRDKRIDDVFQKSNDISQVLFIDEQRTLFIYKHPRSNIMTYH